MRKLALAFLLIAIPLAAAEPKAKPTRAQSVELATRWLDVQRTYEGIPGMSAAIVHDQNEVWAGGFGMADPAAKRAADADTVYSICSISKLFTSISVMQLRDAGKVGLEEPLSKYLPWFTMKPPAEGRDITLRGVLTHSAGLPREADVPYWSGDFDFPTHEQIVARLATQQPLYPSQRYFQYSNLGLTLAGEVVSAASGQSYERYVREHVIEPIGLTSTYPEIPLQNPRLAKGYSARRRDGSRVAVKQFQVRGVAPAAGFASTAHDLARFEEWQLRVLANNDDKVLDPRTLREMQRANWVDPDLKLFQGLGFAIWKTGDDVFVGHGGSCPGFRSTVMLKTDDKIGIAILANASGVNTEEYANAVYEIVAPALKSEWPAENATFDATPYIGSYDEYPWGGETMIVAWGDGLGAIAMPTMHPMKAMQTLRPIGKNQFRRVRDDGTLGETVTFDVGPDGKATRLWRFSNTRPRMQ